ncbi:MAG: SDR family NAD(P)-dependent oxidoreductase [Dermatophilaceae bacterium]
MSAAVPQASSGLRVLVTGGASGLGLALVRIYCARGARVLAVDLAEERPRDLPEGAAYRRLDVRTQQEWDAAAAWVREEWGGLDVLYNNAGVATGGRIDVESMADWQRVLDVNLLGVVRGCQTFTPLFKSQGSGHIVNTASLAGLIHGPGMSSYNASKAGVVALSETLHFELKPFGVNVSVVCPAFFRTNLHESLQGKDEEFEKSGTRMITTAKTSADAIAARVVKGVEAGRHVILTDRMGRTAFWSKRLARPVYERAAMSAAHRIAARSRRTAR